MEQVIYTLTVILAIGTVIMSYLAFRKWKYAKRRQEGMDWLYLQMERALEQIESRDVDEIKAGLQIIRALNVISIRLRALPRLTELLTHHDPHVVALTKDAIENIYPTASILETDQASQPKHKMDKAMALN